MDVLTALASDIVFALRHWEVGLANAVLAIEELADDAVCVLWATGGGDGEGTAGGGYQHVNAGDDAGETHQESLGWAMRASDAAARARSPKVERMVLMMGGWMLGLCETSQPNASSLQVGRYSQVMLGMNLGLLVDVLLMSGMEAEENKRREDNSFAICSTVHPMPCLLHMQTYDCTRSCFSKFLNGKLGCRDWEGSHRFQGKGVNFGASITVTAWQELGCGIQQVQ